MGCVAQAQIHFVPILISHARFYCVYESDPKIEQTFFLRPENEETKKKIIQRDEIQNGAEHLSEFCVMCSHFSALLVFRISMK